jgi:hypothetical protein
MKENIIRMAREAGFADGVVEIVGLEGFARFAALVLAKHPPQSSMAWQEGFEAGRLAEREACAEVADSMDPLQDGAIGNAIRARGQ